MISKDEDPRGNRTGNNQYQTGNIDNINVSSEKSKVPSGTSKAYALQKLSDEGQIELLDQVKAGKISANAAMNKAGYRRPRVAVYLDDPESAAFTNLFYPLDNGTLVVYYRYRYTTRVPLMKGGVYR